MAEATIEDAIQRYAERKYAMGVEHASFQDEDVSRAMFSGLDLDFDELLRLRPGLALAGLTAVVSGQPIEHIMVGQWVDGLVTGMMLMEMRAKADG